MPTAQLQQAYFPEGPWGVILGASSPYVVQAEEAQHFFRLVVAATTNSPPTPTNDVYTVAHDRSLTISAPGVLGNDGDPGGLDLSATYFSPPQHGVVTLLAQGGFLYTPTAGFVGLDQFGYVADNGYLPGGPATVSIIVTNSAPLAQDDHYSVQLGASLTVGPPGVLGNDSDGEGDALSAVLVSAPANGILRIQSDGSFVYKPNLGFSGTDSFIYAASDDLATGTVATVTLNVHGNNQPPSANADTYSGAHDKNLNVPSPGVLANDTDPDGDLLSAILISGTGSGAIDLRPDGSFAYWPASGFEGVDTFSYKTTDGFSTSQTATVTLLITNGVPIALPRTYSLKPDTMLTNPPAGVLFGATDPDHDPLTAQLVSNVGHGTLSLGADGGFAYQPNAGFAGEDSFSYAALDGLASSAPATVTLLVTNHAPVAAGAAYGLCPGTPLALASPGVLANDSDADGDPLAAALITGPSHGALTLTTNGAIYYVPDTGYFGADSFTYAVSDGTTSSLPATVVLTMNTNCEPPAALFDEYLVLPCVPRTTSAGDGVLANDLDPQNAPLSANKVSDVSHGVLSLAADGSFIYTPTPGFAGTDTFSYYASNGSLTSNPVVVTFTVVDSAPVTADDTFTVHANRTLSQAQPGVLDNDEDPDDGDQLMAVLVAGPRHGTLDLFASGAFDYTPATNFARSDSFTYVATDGVLTSAVTTVTIQVQNQAPVASDDDYAVAPYTGSAGSSGLLVSAPGVLANDSDPDEDELSAILLVGPQHASVFQFQADGSFHYVPALNYVGPDSFVYVCTDGVTSSPPATVVLTVSDLPLNRPDFYVYTPGVPLAVDAADGVLANDFAPGAGAFLAAPDGQLPPGFVLNADGGFLFNPPPSNNAPVVARYVANLNSIGSILPGVITLAIQPPYVYLETVSFANGTDIHSDTAKLNNEAPHWRDTNHNGIIDPKAKGERSLAYSCPMQQKPRVGATFVYDDGLAPLKGKEVLVQGTFFKSGKPLGLTIPATVAERKEKEKKLLLPATFTDNPLPKNVDLIDPLQIVWKFSIDKGATWWDCGVSRNRLYVTYDKPKTSPLYETLVYYGCSKGAGLADEKKLGLKIWENFAQRRAQRADGTNLTYYKDWNVFQPAANFNTMAVPGLLKSTDGRCGTWALFAVRSFEAQGLGTAEKVGFAAGGLGFLVNTWNFAGPAGPAVMTQNALVGHGIAPKFPFENVPVFNPKDDFIVPHCAFPDNENVWSFRWQFPAGQNAEQVSYTAGAAQNNTNPRGGFLDHAVIKFGGSLYDPSYGGGPFKSLLDLQNSELSGFCALRKVQDATRLKPVVLFGPAYSVLGVRQVDPKVQEIK